MDKMTLDIYKSMEKPEIFLSIESGKDIKEIKFPSNFDIELLNFKLFKSKITMSSDEKRIAIDCKQVLDEISKKGFSIHSAKISIKIVQ